MDGKWQQLKEWMDESSNIVFFGGAGVSTESGIPDFRSVDGLYNQQYKYPPETIISHSFYVRYPEEFYRFYKDRMLFTEARPNAAHKALAHLEALGKLKAVITQNIDGLHQMAGSREVLELHGSVHRNYCTRAISCFFGGAGVSTESGIPDFRSVDGLYNQQYKYPPETIISHSFYVRYPEEFYRFYKDRMLFTEARPNAAHKALAHLEALGKLKAVITQNIDGLHQMAGSREVLELHGSVHRNYCTRCGEFHDLDYVVKCDGVPHCSCGGVIKPDVVLYEEGLDNRTLQKAVNYIRNADVLIVGGTSLVVYPAAGLIDYYRGSKLVLINKGATSRDSQADLVISDRIGEVLGAVTGVKTCGGQTGNREEETGRKDT